MGKECSSLVAALSARQTYPLGNKFPIKRRGEIATRKPRAKQGGAGTGNLVEEGVANLSFKNTFYHGELKIGGPGPELGASSTVTEKMSPRVRTEGSGRKGIGSLEQR